MRALSLLMVLLFLVPAALASSPADGRILTEVEYTLPVFETTDFMQTPEIKKWYETVLKSALERAQTRVDMKTVEYSSDGLKVKGFILAKRDASPGARLPIVSWSRGGNRDFGRLNVKDMIWLSKLADKGYVVVATQYRGVDGEKQGTDQFGGKDVDDVLNLIKLAKSLPYADPTHVFAAGHSRGGMETFLTLKDDPEIRAAVSLAGECDLAAGLKSRPDMETEVYAKLIPNYWKDKQKALDERSACAWPEKINAPLYIMQGTDDVQVDPPQAQELAQALAENGKVYKLEMRPGGHDIWFSGQVANEVISKMDAWFQANY